MWAIIKAILVYVFLRILSVFVTVGIIVATGARQEASMVRLATTMDHWSFWFSFIVALYVLFKSW
jgi:hypothetical protein